MFGVVLFVPLLYLVSEVGADDMIPDWLVTKINTPTTLTKTSEGTLLLSNGLISREFVTTPDFGTVDFYSYREQSSALRAINPEAIIALGKNIIIKSVLILSIEFLCIINLVVENNWPHLHDLDVNLSHFQTVKWFRKLQVAET